MKTPNLYESSCDLLAFIQSTGLFKGVRTELLEEFSSGLERLLLGGGETLFNQGDVGDAFYLVVNGRLQVAVGTGDGGEVVVGEIEPGKPVGEMNVLMGGSRTARVSAVEDTELVKVSKTAIESLVQKDPGAIGHLVDLISRRVRRSQLLLIFPRLFGPLDDAMLQSIEAEMEWCKLARGEALFRQGDPGDSLYIVVGGRLKAVVEDEAGNEQVVGEIIGGESVGEMAVITDEPRSAAIYAARDSELVKFSKAAFERIVTEHPRILMAITKLITRRLSKTIRAESAPATADNIAIVPAVPTELLDQFSDRLVAALTRLGSTLHLSGERLEGLSGIPAAGATENELLRFRLNAWLDEQETKYRFIVYQADQFSSAWTRRCIRQADHVLMVAEAAADPSPGAIEATFPAEETGVNSARRTLILIHPDGSRLPTGTDRWLASHQVDRHHHVRRDTADDFGRLARFLGGRAIGLALSGGGSRGFAHLGVIRALNEAGVPIDMVGGTSMGSVIASNHAMGLDDDTIRRVLGEGFNKYKPFSEYTLPIISVIGGTRLERFLTEVYGDTRIEDLWVNFFSVSSNLSTADIHVHDKGPLFKAVRASVSLPGIATPVLHGNDLLVDGGVLNNLPGDIMRKSCGGPVIAVDISGGDDLKVDYDRIPSAWEYLLAKLLSRRKAPNIPSMFNVLMRTTMLNSIHRTHVVKRDVDLYLRPPVSQFKLLDFSVIDEIVRAGYEYAKTAIAECRDEKIISKQT